MPSKSPLTKIQSLVFAPGGSARRKSAATPSSPPARPILSVSMTWARSSRANLTCSLWVFVSVSSLPPVASGGDGAKGRCVLGRAGSVMMPDQCLLKLSAVATEVALPLSKKELRHGLSGRARPAKFARIRFSLARHIRFCRRTSKMHRCIKSRSPRASVGRVLLCLVRLFSDSSTGERFWLQLRTAPTLPARAMSCSMDSMLFHESGSKRSEHCPFRCGFPPRPSSPDKRSLRNALLGIPRDSHGQGDM